MCLDHTLSTLRCNTCFQADQGIIKLAQFKESLAHEIVTLYQTRVDVNSLLAVLYGFLPLAQFQVTQSSICVHCGVSTITALRHGTRMYTVHANSSQIKVSMVKSNSLYQLSNFPVPARTFPPRRGCYPYTSHPSSESIR